MAAFRSRAPTDRRTRAGDRRSRGTIAAALAVSVLVTAVLSTIGSATAGPEGPRPSQGGTATLEGFVKPTTAVVTLTFETTQKAQTVNESRSTGFYLVPNLKPGIYVLAAHAGINQYTSPPFPLGPGPPTWRNISLVPGTYKGWIQGDISPSSALVLLNGVRIHVNGSGSYNVSENASSTGYVLNVSAAGYQPLTELVPVGANTTTWANVSLASNSGLTTGQIVQYAVVGGVVAAAIIVTVLYAVRHRRPKAPSPAPPAPESREGPGRKRKRSAEPPTDRQE